MMDWYGSHMSGGDWLVMSLIMGAVWALLILASVMVFRGSASWRTPSAHREPMAILDERFAQGEMDADEYETRRAALRALN